MDETQKAEIVACLIEVMGSDDIMVVRIAMVDLAESLDLLEAMRSEIGKRYLLERCGEAPPPRSREIEPSRTARLAPTASGLAEILTCERCFFWLEGEEADRAAGPVCQNPQSPRVNQHTAVADTCGKFTRKGAEADEAEAADADAEAPTETAFCPVCERRIKVQCRGPEGIKLRAHGQHGQQCNGYKVWIQE